MQPSESMFRVPPFPAFPSASRYVNLGSLADALHRVVRSVDAREGLSLVIGPPGTGKSLLCGILAEHFANNHEVVTLGETPIDSGAAMLRRVLHQLGVKLSSIPDNDLQLALIDRVCAKGSPSGGLLVLVDEAQSLPTEVLEAIRMTTNIMRRGEPRVSVVVCGGPRLDETLASPMMEPFTQRIATRCYLHPMSSSESREYIREAIRRCGAEPSDTISDEAISAVHHACSGVPRLINQLMTQAVDCAEAANRTLIGLHEINVAWAQLQQLPSPMLEEPELASRPTNATSAHATSTVEFGELDELRFPSQHSDSTAQNEQEDEHEDELSFESASPDCESQIADSIVTHVDDEELACGTTCGCDPEVCQREVAAAERIDAMSESLEFADDSAQWICEPGDDARSRHEPPQSVKMIAPRSPLPAALFGVFDDEEDVAVGRPVAVKPTACRSQSPAELEAMLHQEIVGMTNDMQLYECATNAYSTFDGPTGDYEESTGDGALFSKPATSTSNGHSSANSAGASDLVFSNDDSDILVIEEDVSVHGRVEPTRTRREESTISVDFQAMLTRMRNG